MRHTGLYLVLKDHRPEGCGYRQRSIPLSDSVLTIEGKKSREEKVNEDNYCRSERAFGSFSRSIELPTEVNDEQVKATFKNGVLEIRLPKTEESKKRVVKVRID
jgi:HSP20 family protein